MWIYLTLLSAIFLGIYDIFKKHALKENSVLYVLFFSVLSGGVFVVITGYLILPNFIEVTYKNSSIDDFLFHLLVFFKSFLVGLCWLCAYAALKYLPVSVASPIRSSEPLWTLFIALIFLQERPGLLQIIGVVIILLGYYGFSLISIREGIEFKKNKWISLAFLAAFIGALSSIYDKYLFNSLKLSPISVQIWFSIYMVLLIGLFCILYQVLISRKKLNFEWRWSIPFIGISLFFADILYFYALNIDDALISIVSVLRRCSSVVSFFIGAIIFKEKNIKLKLLGFIIILFGVLLILL